MRDTQCITNVCCSPSGCIIGVIKRHRGGVQETSDPMSKKVSIYGYLREIMLLIYKRDERGYFFHNEIVSRCAMERINIEIYE